jgi:coniferyl-aldehyde dehydrogenase
LVPKESIDEFAEAEIKLYKNVWSHITNNENYTSIVNDRHLKRIQDILTDAQEKGADYSLRYL